MSVETLSIEQVATFPPLGKDIAHLEDGYYTVKPKDPVGYNTASDHQIQSKVWFSTPPLSNDTIERISGMQLFAECHDQGFADDEAAGNWTWIELEIRENRDAEGPRVKDGITLAWKSQYNRFLTDEFDWSVGEYFGDEHDLFGQLEDGNIITVNLCARFSGWEIFTKKGYLVLKLDGKTVKTGVDYKPYVENINSIQSVFNEANDALQAAFAPSVQPELFVANSFTGADKPPLRVLSLDGGGVRGISSLYILKQVMKEMFGRDDTRPCDVFDMIAGTSTGGLIAIMLGRLGMTVDECIKNYEDFATRVFKYGMVRKYANLAANGTFYNGDDLEKVIKECVQKTLGDGEAKLLDDNTKCKVFVMAVREDAANNRGPVFLRSYTNKEKLSDLPDISIWQAARATSAAPVYFPPITVGKFTLVDGGLAANNPIGWLWNECMDVFGVNRPTACFLSIGTGIPKNKAVGKVGLTSQKELADGLAGAATNSQLAHLLFQTAINAYAPLSSNRKYWRFNISEEVPEYFTEERDGNAISKWFKSKKKVLHLDNFEDIGDLDDVALMKVLTEMTKEYAKLEKEDIKDCVDALNL